MTDLISVALTDLREGDSIPQLNASVVKVTKIKVGRTVIVRNHYVDLSDGRVLLTHQRLVVRRNPDGRLIAPWVRVQLDSKVGIHRVDSNET